MSARLGATRLRWICSKDPAKIELFLAKLKRRVQIYEIVFAKNKWWCWVVPGDGEPDIISRDLD